MNKKKYSLLIILAFLILTLAALIIKPISLEIILCLELNIAVILFSLVWGGYIKVCEERYKLISGCLWYGVLLIAIFESLKYIFFR